MLLFLSFFFFLSFSVSPSFEIKSTAWFLDRDQRSSKWAEGKKERSEKFARAYQPFFLSEWKRYYIVRESFAGIRIARDSSPRCAIPPIIEQKSSRRKTDALCFLRRQFPSANGDAVDRKVRGRFIIFGRHDGKTSSGESKFLIRWLVSWGNGVRRPFESKTSSVVGWKPTGSFAELYGKLSFPGRRTDFRNGAQTFSFQVCPAFFFFSSSFFSPLLFPLFFHEFSPLRSLVGARDVENSWLIEFPFFLCRDC